jgi:hypothetical protein
VAGHDVFLSYHWKGPTGIWVPRFFQKELAFWLNEQFPDRAATVFYDRESITIGDQTGRELLDALGRTRVFVPVLSPSYFTQSRWCAWEWRCFHAWRPAAVMPVLYYNFKALPDFARALNMEDFSDVNATFEGWPNTPQYGQFQERVKKFAEKIARRMRELEPPPESGFPPTFTPPPIPEPEGLPPIDQRRMAA